MLKKAMNAFYRKLLNLCKKLISSPAKIIRFSRLEGKKLLQCCPRLQKGNIMSAVSTAQSQTSSWQETLRQEILQPALSTYPSKNDDANSYFIEVLTWSFSMLKERPAQAPREEMETFIRENIPQEKFKTLIIDTFAEVIRKVARERLKFIVFEYPQECIARLQGRLTQVKPKQAPSIPEYMTVETAPAEESDFEVVDLKPASSVEGPASLENKEKLLKLWIQKPHLVLPPDFIQSIAAQKPSPTESSAIS